MIPRPTPTREDAPAVTLPPTITIPTPHVPTGPKGVPPRESDPAYLDSAAWNLENGYKVGGSGVTAMVVRLLRHAAHAVRTADEPAPTLRPLTPGDAVTATDLPPVLAAVLRERRRAPHQCEAWQMQESAKGGVYCGACGDGYPDGFPGARDGSAGAPGAATAQDRADAAEAERDRLVVALRVLRDDLRREHPDPAWHDVAGRVLDRLDALVPPAPEATAAVGPHRPVSETGHRWPCRRFYVTASVRDTCTCDAAARGVSS